MITSMPLLPVWGLRRIQNLLLMSLSKSHMANILHIVSELSERVEIVVETNHTFLIANLILFSCQKSIWFNLDNEDIHSGRASIDLIKPYTDPISLWNCSNLKNACKLQSRRGGMSNSARSSLGSDFRTRELGWMGVWKAVVQVLVNFGTEDARVA